LEIYKIDKGKIYLKIPFEDKEIIKQVPGRRWSSKTKLWNVSYDEDTVALVNSLLGTKISSPEIPRASKTDRAPAADLVLDNLYEHQKQSVSVARKTKYFADLSEPGTGKTLVQIELMLERDEWPVLVVCPKSIMEPVWDKQLMDINKPLSPVILNGGSAKIKKNLKQFIDIEENELPWFIFIINYEMVPLVLNVLLKIKWKSIICDESTKIKNHVAKRSRAIMKLRDQVNYRSIMTGTPAPNGMIDIYNQINWLNPQVFGDSYYAFRFRYFNSQNDLEYYLKDDYLYIKFSYGRKIVDEIKKHGTFFWDKYENAWRSKFKTDKLDDYSTKLIQMLKLIPCEIYSIKEGAFEKVSKKLSGFSIQHKKRECIDLPPLVEEIRNVEMTARQKDFYEKMKKECIIWLNENQAVTAPFVITKLMKLRQIASGFVYLDEKTYPISSNNPKDAVMLEILEQIGDEKCIIFAHFNRTMVHIHEKLYKTYKEKVTSFYGSDKPIALKKFEDEAQILIANPASAGHGLNLQHCSNIIYYENDWNLENYEQSWQRIERIGQKNKMTVYHIITKDTIENYIYKKLKTKQDINKSLDINELKGAL